MAKKEDSQSSISYTNSNLLSQGYVYYKELSEYEPGSKQAILYQNVKNSLSIAKGVNVHFETSSMLLEMAKVEREKEKAFLENIFGFKIHSELNEETAGKEIIEAFNSTLNIKAAYDRNIKRILRGQTRVDIASFFDYYLKEEFTPQRINGIVFSALNQVKKGTDLATALETRINIALDKVIDDALNEALGSKVFGNQNNKEDDAYLDLLNALNKNFDQKNWLKRQIYNNYEFDEVKKQLMTTLQLSQSAQNKQEAREKVKSIVSNDTNRYRQNGLTREYLMNTISNFIINEIGSSNKYTIKGGGALHTGNINQMKADNILSFNIPIGEINEVLQKVEGKGREANVNIIRRLGEKLSNIDNGTIIYTSSKNYTIGSNFEKHGFSSGEAIKLRIFKELLLDSPYRTNAYSLIGAIEQLLKGAVGEGRNEEYASAIARYVAYFLFDDIGTIGTKIGGSTTSALHLFDLDGIYIPLSFFLNLLGKAFNSVAKQPVNLIRVNIQLPKGGGILYSHQPPYTKEKWDNQRDAALDQIKISVNFLKSFKDILRRL